MVQIAATRRRSVMSALRIWGRSAGGNELGDGAHGSVRGYGGVGGQSRAVGVDPDRVQAESVTGLDLPPEVAVKGKCAHLKRCLYGTRDAASRWEALYTEKLEAMGFHHGKAGAFCVVHGGDFILLSTDEALNEIEVGMQQAFLCNIEGRLGSGARDLKEARVLGRIIHWTKTGLRYEADPRHVEILVKYLGLE